MKTPQGRSWLLETEPRLPAGTAERFAGYGIMGIPFASGHILALRRFPASSIGPAYTSVWHRDPAGRWIVYANVEPHLGCSRFFGDALIASVRTEVSLRWSDAWSLVAEVPAAALFWQVGLAETAATRLLNLVAGLLPGWVWRSPSAVGAIGKAAGRLLGAGRLALSGHAPNGQRYLAVPRTVWSVRDSIARVDGVDLGVPAPLPIQARLGDFLIPQRGLFVVGRAVFDPFDPACHLSATAAATHRRPVSVVPSPVLGAASPSLRQPRAPPHPTLGKHIGGPIVIS